jgi:hypothetical protein
LPIGCIGMVKNPSCMAVGELMKSFKGSPT